MKRTSESRPYGTGPEPRMPNPNGSARPPRPRTRQQIPPGADRELVYDGRGPGTASAFVDDEAVDVVEQLGGRQREDDVRANATNPPDGPAPFKPTR
jgi:hypothetical protein